jgi:hypothetical protein
MSHCVLSLLLFLLGGIATVKGIPPPPICDTFFYPEGCQGDQISFKRQSFAANTRKEMSIYARGHSTESVILHILLVFTDNVHHFHNTLLFNPLRIENYRKILHESEFPFNNEIVVITKGKETTLQYDVAPLYMNEFLGPIGYDAILSLDRYASLWSEYNSYVVERAALTLKKTDESMWYEGNVEDFTGLYLLRCNDSLSYKHCHVAIRDSYKEGGNLLVNGMAYKSCGLVINTSSTINLLPYDLYMWWVQDTQKDLFIGGDEAHHLLHLNPQFSFGINHDSTNIVVGIDLLFLFQRVEFCGEGGYYKAWYTHIYHNHNDHVFNTLIMFFFEVCLLCIFFYWATSPNYEILSHALNGGKRFEFPYRMIWWEFSMWLIAAVVWIITFVMTDGISSATFIYDNSDCEKRKLLFVLFSAYHVALSLIFFGVQHKLTRYTIRYYYSYWLYLTYAKPTDRNYAELVKRVNTPTYSVEEKYVIMRNIVLQNLVASNLLLVLNYMAEEKPIYLNLVAIVSITLSYYYVKLIQTGMVYVFKSSGTSDTWSALWKKESGTILFLLGSIVVFTLYFIFSLKLVYYSLYDEKNSTYCSIILWVFVIAPLSLVVVFAVSVVFLQLLHHMTTHKKVKIN